MQLDETQGRSNLNRLNSKDVGLTFVLNIRHLLFVLICLRVRLLGYDLIYRQIQFRILGALPYV